MSREPERVTVCDPDVDLVPRVVLPELLWPVARGADDSRPERENPALPIERPLVERPDELLPEREGDEENERRALGELRVVDLALRPEDRLRERPADDLILDRPVDDRIRERPDR